MRTYPTPRGSVTPFGPGRGGEGLTYLASPYSHPDPAVREERFRAACCQAAEMLRCGITVFSPIAHSHHLAALGLPGGWDFWGPHCRPFIAACREVWVLQLPGWRESVGIREELRIAEEVGKPVIFVEADGSANEVGYVGALKRPRPAAASRAGVVFEPEATDADIRTR